MKKIAIHQPNLLPWMGYFQKLKSADEFIFLDHVAFSKGSYTNRVRIHKADGLEEQWLSIPIKKHSLGTPISEIQIDRTKDIEDYLLSKIHQSYHQSPSYKDFFPKLKSTIESMSEIDSLSIYNKALISFIMEYKGIQTSIIDSESLGLSDSSEQVVLQICKQQEADIYISGMGGKNYLDEEAFSKANIEIEYSDFVGECQAKNMDKKLIGKSCISWLFSKYEAGNR